MAHVAAGRARLPVQCLNGLARQLKRGSRPKAVLPFGLRQKTLPSRLADSAFWSQWRLSRVFQQPANPLPSRVNWGKMTGVG
jgi:hypothetical protein